MKKLMPISFCLLLLAACKVELPPIESCIIANASAGIDSPDKKELSPAQLKPLSDWFAAHGGGWEYKVTDNAPEGKVLLLKHQGGRVTHVNLRSDALWVGNRVKILTSKEHAEILAILDPKNELPAFGR